MAIQLGKNYSNVVILGSIKYQCLCYIITTKNRFCYQNILHNVVNVKFPTKICSRAARLKLSSMQWIVEYFDTLFLCKNIESLAIGDILW